ncbi:1,6-anhydro-N-acetylmuramyl-L-alanine amidase AmpD [Methylocaldum sp.]|uniref:1,6-anhydro-N-acetylmuramyl-L-alanine amidase AmpD n=1 Tax=Methylocaldum sp. TaxID=1969727 RepID=UPI002D2CDEE5|nr:1,6-anhydro-N-acetylmuramyl-L-alanine amidase AmpD [Methylocaldum sp.]HYE35973.1 1,6-anhydro-N-acetylmuramyl-L-alanine amidase AmpD [Methylocaldum sp.]
MKIIDDWLASARRVDSCNCDDRPDVRDISVVVIHCISLPPGEFSGEWIDCLFTNALEAAAHPYFEGLRGLRVSAHALIRRDGEIVQYVPFHRRAWHAGISNYQGRGCCNDFSIGLELEGADDIPYTEVQYERLSDLLVALFKKYPGLSPDRIVGHSDIAPDRKTDPGPSFDWGRLYSLLSLRGFQSDRMRRSL